MNGTKILGKVGMVVCLLAACSPAISKAPQVTTTGPTEAQKSNPYPLSEPGPYHVGVRSYTFTDAERNGREVAISVYYPAVPPDGTTGTGPFPNADPDPQDAPYPLILSSTKVASIFAKYLASQGFIWIGINKIDSYYHMNEEMVDQPLDILFALNQVGSNPLDGLDAMLDTGHAGVTGYSFDGYNTLALSGARINPRYYLAQCPNPDRTTQAILGGESAFYCGPADAWDEFTAHAGQAITASQDGLWQPMTDERIRAVMPMAGEGWWLFGKKGLAAVDRPTLMIAATQDELYAENALIFKHLGTHDKALISFIGHDHMMIYNPEMTARMAHFMAAFFGYHLQGREDYAVYFSKDFVARHDDLAWGVYQK
jgi:predicted dienelactone hydrolase